MIYIVHLSKVCIFEAIKLSSVQFSCSVMSNSLRPHELQHARPPCPSPTPGVHSDSCPSSQWCHPAISSSVVPFSSCPPSLPASESFPMNLLFAWGGQSTAVSALASFLPKKSQGWSPSEWTGWISLQSKGFSRVFSNTWHYITLYCWRLFFVIFFFKEWDPYFWHISKVCYKTKCGLFFFLNDSFHHPGIFALYSLVVFFGCLDLLILK